MAGELVDATLEFWYDSTWNDHTDQLYNRDSVRITRGIANEGGRADPGTCAFTINNRNGEFSPRNPRSSLFGKIGRNTPVRISAGLVGETQSIRFVGEVVQWPPRWDVSEQDVYVPVQAAGILRRLGTPGQPLRSALVRWLRDAEPHSWWPLDDGPGTSRARSAVEGGALLKPSGQSRYQQPVTGVPVPPAGAPEFAGGTLGPLFNSSFVSLQSGGELSAILDVSSTRYRLECTMLHDRTARDQVHRTDAGQASWDTVRLRFGDGDGGGTDFEDWDLNFSVPSDENFSPQVRLFGDGFGAALTADMFVYDGLAHRYRIDIEQSGSVVIAYLYIDGQEIEQKGIVGTIGPLHEIIINRLDHGHSGMPAIGHVVLWTDFDHDSADAASGYEGETAGRRVERLCGEESVSFTSTGDLDETIPMGPQRPDQFLALLDAAATAEASGSRLPILVEQREALGLHFNALSSFYITS